MRTFQQAHKVAGTPPVHLCSRIFQPLDVQRLNDVAEAFLDPGPLVYGAGEAVPNLGNAEPYEPSRHTIGRHT